MRNGLVSIVVTVYNLQDYIAECIDSIINQTYNKLEILIVDDGSTDDSLRICKRIEAQYDNVTIISQPNSGVSVARNTGIANANGEYIMFVDGDDMLKPRMIERLVGEIDRQTDFVCCSYTVLETEKDEQFFDNPIIAASIEEKEPFVLQILDNKYMCSPDNATAIGVPWGKLFRKSFIMDNGLRFDPELRRLEDPLFILNAIACSKTIRYIPESLYKYRVGHINSFRVYNEDVYTRYLIKQDEFFSHNKEFINNQVARYLQLQHFSFLMSSLRSITDDKTISRSQRINEIKICCNKAPYKQKIRGMRFNGISGKRKVQLFAYNLHLYGLLDLFCIMTRR